MPDLGPWPPEERPRVWVLHQGQWVAGQLLAWIPPGQALATALRGDWAGHVRWSAPPDFLLQHELVLPARWLAAGGEPAPDVPAGEVGFVPPSRAV